MINKKLAALVLLGMLIFYTDGGPTPALMHGDHSQPRFGVAIAELLAEAPPYPTHVPSELTID